MLYEIITEAIVDCVKMLPFLFLAFFILELTEHHAQDKMEKLLTQVRYGGPLLGALLGCIPQCGFSIIAAGLYSGGIISLGTLISVFLATSDEAILILLSHTDAAHSILPLVGAKLVIAVVAGYAVDIVSRHYKMTSHNVDELCTNCGCHNDHSIWRPALRHTTRIFGFLLVVTILLNGAVEWLGTARLEAILLKDSLLQLFLASLVGMIPNCVASVLLTELYLEELLSFPAVISGLCTGAGLGLLMLFKTNHHQKENLRVAALLYGFAILAGLILTVLSGIC